MQCIETIIPGSHFLTARSADLSKQLLTGLLQVRAFAPWPGTSCTYEKESENGTIEEVEVKILKTNLCSASDWPADAKNNVAYEKKVMYIKCRNGEVLTVEKLQHHGKSPVDPVAFFNGLQGRTVRIKQ